MTTHFDVIVIGSGFGGGVMACRLAEAGMSVCVLERGKPYPPGSFARTTYAMRRNFWDPSEGLYGLFDVWSFRGLEGLVSSGLGGGSLIYANVLLRKDEKWFVKEGAPGDGYEHWPVNRQELDPYYDRAEAMLGATKYPLDREPYARTPKTNAMRDAARALNLDWQLPPLAVSFAEPEQAPGEPIRNAPDNLHGRTRLTCSLCGECDAGCNTGSKNTVDYNYLSQAARQHADIRSLAEVRSFVPVAEGYRVEYVQHELEREGRKIKTESLPVTTITSKYLVLSAGTFGSTYLLLRNRNALGPMPALGTRFCGNGDLLTFGLKCRQQGPNGLSGRVLDASYGPVITSAIRGADSLDGNPADGRGFYIEDAGYPAFLSWLVELSDAPHFAVRFIRLLTARLTAVLRSDRHSELSGQLSRMLGDCSLSQGSVPLLGMGRDIPNGHMTLSDGWLDIDWTTKASNAYFVRLRDTMERIVDYWGGSFRDNPLWYFRRVITVHPLGGCPMGRHQREGVVDVNGEVFNNPGLFVADGSIMPGPVGANPSLTIAALSERCAERLADRPRH